LAAGLVTGIYNDGIPADALAGRPGFEWLRERLEGPLGEARLAAIRTWSEIAAELGTSMPRLALAWCLKNQNVSTAIMGATSPEVAHDLLDAAFLTRTTIYFNHYLFETFRLLQQPAAFLARMGLWFDLPV
jgi:aryl-alcohol dehydrogenase-like predicted oxidoreductase